jgi:phage shock protein PspC (stress-responsive transcriptional regulator)
MTRAFSFMMRDDTLLGVCFAIGEDFGFSPTILRLLFAVSLFWSPLGAIAAYAAAGGVVALSRVISPDPVPAVAAEEAECFGDECEEYRLAA